MSNAPLAANDAHWARLRCELLADQASRADSTPGRWDGPCGVYEFRVVTLPKAMINDIPEQYKEKSTGTLKLLWEVEWRKQLGITQVRDANPQTSSGQRASRGDGY